MGHRSDGMPTASPRANSPSTARNTARHQQRPEHLHGGSRALTSSVWKAKPESPPTATPFTSITSARTARRASPAPTTHVTYTLEQRQRAGSIQRQDRQDDVVNLTNHSYWNLAGAGSGDSSTTSLCSTPTTTPGRRHPDPDRRDRSRQGHAARLHQAQDDRPGHRQDRKRPNGYDHNYVLNWHGRRYAQGCPGRSTQQRPRMEVSTTEPGVQLYTANFLDGRSPARRQALQQHGAFCLETQHYPDSPNRPEFPTTTLKPGDTYGQLTEYIGLAWRSRRHA